MEFEGIPFEFERESYSKSCVPIIYGSKESGRGGGLNIDVSTRLDKTAGASDLAKMVLQKELVIQRHFADIASFLRMKTASVIPRITCSTRNLQMSEDELDNLFHQIECQIKAVIEADPIEDGFFHPAEVLLQKFIDDFSHRAGDWLFALLSDNRWNTSLRASLLRLLSRQKPLTEKWRLHLIELGLSSSNLEIRDAAVQAAEYWEDAGAARLLREHGESCAWLADYISRVLQELTR